MLPSHREHCLRKGRGPTTHSIPKPTPDPSRLGASGHGDDTLLGGRPIPYIVTAASAAAPSLDGPLDQPPGQPALPLSRSPLY